MSISFLQRRLFLYRVSVRSGHRTSDQEYIKAFVKVKVALQLFEKLLQKFLIVTRNKLVSVIMKSCDFIPSMKTSDAYVNYCVIRWIKRNFKRKLNHSGNYSSGIG